MLALSLKIFYRLSAHACRHTHTHTHTHTHARTHTDRQTRVHMCMTERERGNTGGIRKFYLVDHIAWKGEAKY